MKNKKELKKELTSSLSESIRTQLMNLNPLAAEATNKAMKTAVQAIVKRFFKKLKETEIKSPGKKKSKKPVAKRKSPLKKKLK